MSRWTFEDAERFCAWLDTHRGFPDAVAQALTRSADGALRLVLSERLSGGTLAGSEEVVREIVLTASDVRSARPSPVLLKGHRWEGMRGAAASGGIALVLHLPSEVTVLCGRVDVEEGEERTRVVPPSMDECRLRCTFGSARVPGPLEWVERFRAHGVFVEWVDLGNDGGDPPGPSTVEGGRLQEPERAEDWSGLGFSICRVVDGALLLEWNGADASPTLWRAAKLVAGDQDDLIEVKSGNCVFDAKQWRQWLRNGAFPLHWYGRSAAKAALS